MTPASEEKYIYFIRHGQSEANGKDIFQGADTNLTDLGRQQAAFVAERVRDLGAEVILASTMPRAVQTAKALQEAANIPLETSDLLHEYIPPSCMIGKSKVGPEGKACIDKMLKHIHDPEWHFEDEENYHDMHARAVKFLDVLLARPEARILVVSHAGFMRVLFTAMMTEGQPDAKLTAQIMRFFRPMNTGVTIVRYDPEEDIRNKWRLITWNDHAHLAETDLEEPKDYYL